MGRKVRLDVLLAERGLAPSREAARRMIMAGEVRVAGELRDKPGMRVPEKRAVRDGGCGNHRFGLFDMVLIKDNHLVAGGGIAATVRKAKASAPFSMKVEVEVRDEDGLREAIAAGADIVMLDNMPPVDMARCAAVARELAPHVLLEASGRITLDTVGAVARTGVDFISASALTAGAPPVDLALDFVGYEEEPCC